MGFASALETASALLDHGSADAAVRVLRGAWEPELPRGDRTALYCLWIRALCESGELGPACVLANRASSELPDEPEILIAVGNVRDLLGDLEAAKTAFQRAIHLEGGALAQYNLGTVLERLGDDEGAASAYRRSLQHDGEVQTRCESASALGTLLRRSGRSEAAAEVYETYLEGDPINVPILVEHGISLSDLEDFEDAVARFDLALSVEPDHTNALYNKAVTLYRMGRHREALRTMRRAHASDPENALTRAVLGSWQLTGATDDEEGALSLLYGALHALEQADRHASVTQGYAGVVVEEVFDALWTRGHAGEAREVARWAGQRDWITVGILETLNEADHGRVDGVSSYVVTARALAGTAPDHWPEDVDGYTTDLTVVAATEEDARRYTLEYLTTVEGAPGVRFVLDVVHSNVSELVAHLDSASLKPPAQGVARVNTGRAYFRD